MKQEIEKLTLELAAQLSQNADKICTAESCTGGLIAKTFTDLAGSSAWFDRGYITYSNQAKIDMLGVMAPTLQVYGAVSEQVVREMVMGAQRKSKISAALAVTGIAGPDGGSDTKPVGTVWFGFALGKRVVSEQRFFEGNRLQIRHSCLLYALNRMIFLLQQ